MSPSAPDQIGTDRQLFVDDYWTAKRRGAERKLHSPVRREIAIAADNPWEEVDHFHGGADLGRLAGTTVRLRFVLKDADLYAFRFRSG